MDAARLALDFGARVVPCFGSALGGLLAAISMAAFWGESATLVLGLLLVAILVMLVLLRREIRRLG